MKHHYIGLGVVYYLTRYHEQSKVKKHIKFPHLKTKILFRKRENDVLLAGFVQTDDFHENFASSIIKVYYIFAYHIHFRMSEKRQAGAKKKRKKVKSLQEVLSDKKKGRWKIREVYINFNIHTITSIITAIN